MPASMPLQWKPDQKTHLAIGTADLNRTVVAVGNGFCYGKAKAIVMAVAACLISTVKTVKNVFLLFRRDLRADVGYCKKGVSSFLQQADRHRLTGRAVADRIVNKNGNKLFELYIVSNQAHGIVQTGLQQRGAPPQAPDGSGRSPPLQARQLRCGQDPEAGQ